MCQYKNYRTEEELDNVDDIEYYNYKTESALMHFRDLGLSRFAVANKQDAKENLIYLIDALGALEDTSIIPSDDARQIITNVKIALAYIERNLIETK